ncbi:uncharacterized protein L3040_009057 [Drepanopeziza brunnea f. sp. 'multigermtubi']|uniref:uncharacterized protein n=1 Tax=Drepanopeziza brunnea f. sp. 'multigermtubi' TaxID=698441 RepID=UPI0023844071|nr:hypothetical protein L3040_009057 [Drepanopeziza brunnea f. sp. 'multigermtubi']
MAIISGATIITSISLFHITLAFFFLTSPSTIADQTLVFIIGEAMSMPHSRSFDLQSAPLAFLAAVLLVVGVTDLVAISLPEEISQYHWGSQAPVRLVLFFFITFYSYFFSSTSPFYTSSRSSAYQANDYVVLGVCYFERREERNVSEDSSEEGGGGGYDVIALPHRCGIRAVPKNMTVMFVGFSTGVKYRDPSGLARADCGPAGKAQIPGNGETLAFVVQDPRPPA